MPPTDGGALSALTTVATAAFSAVVSLLPASTKSETPGLRNLTPACQLAVGVAALASLKVATLYFSRQLNLRRRRHLILRMVRVVTRWEAVCVAEVARLVSGSISNEQHERRRAALCGIVRPHRAAEIAASWAWLAAEGAPEECGEAPGSFHGIVPSVVFSADFSIGDYIALWEACDHVLTRRHDRALVESLSFIVHYAMFRWLALAEEARLYCALYRCYVLSPLGRGSWTRHHNRTPPQLLVEGYLGAWREYGRPTWLVPHAGGYLCLPLSYFPVDTLLTYMAEFDWLKDTLLQRMLPRWRGQCRRSLQRRRPSTSVGCREAAQSFVEYLFLHYTHTLARHHLATAAVESRRFYRECFRVHLFPGAAPKSVENRCLLPQSSHPWRCEVDRATARRFRIAFVIHVATECLCEWCLTVFPRFSIANQASRLTAVLAHGLLPAGGTTDVDVGGDDHSATASTTQDLPRMLAYQMVMGSLANIVRTVLKSSTKFASDELNGILSAQVGARLQDAMVCADEAFYIRLTNSHRANGASFNPAFTSNRMQGRSESTANIAQYATASGTSLINALNREVCWWSTFGCAAALVFVRGDYAAAAAATAIALMREAPVERLAVTLGFSIPTSVSNYVSSCDEAIIASATAEKSSRYGLGVLLDVLSEDWSPAGGCAARPSHLPHPFLALVVCQGHSGLLGATWSCSDGAAAVLQRMMRVQDLYKAAACYPYRRTVAQWGGGTECVDCVEALQVDVETALHFDVAPERRSLASTFCTATMNVAAGRPSQPARSSASLLDRLRRAHYRVRPGSMAAGESATVAAAHGASSVPAQGCATLHHALDPAEVAILQSLHTLRYLDSEDSTNFSTIFSLPYRLVLRHLGLEAVFAYRSATATQLGMQQRLCESVDAIFQSALFSPFTAVVWECMTVAEACAVLMAACCTLTEGGGLRLQSLPVTDLYEMGARVRVYKLAVSSLLPHPTGIGWGFLRRIHQLSTCLPATIADATEWSRSPQVCGRRAAWMDYASASPDAFHFVYDDCARIVGGLGLRVGLRCEAVHFAYPQLHGDGAGVLPTLSGVSASLPAMGMTAVIGRSGAGKSTLFHLLQRFYDPLPLVSVQWSESTPTGQHYGWTVGLLAQVMWLQHIAHPLPAPPPIHQHLVSAPWHNSCLLPTATLTSSGAAAVSLERLPAACFAVSHLRQWLQVLEQSATVAPQLTFSQNVASRSQYVVPQDVQHAIALCQCTEMVQRAPLQLDSKVGILSRGECQRLALASVVAAACGRARFDRLQQCFRGDESAGPPQTVCGCLLLDEPTSNLDAHNEMQLQFSIEALLPKTGSRRGEMCDADSVECVSQKAPHEVADVVALMMVVIAHRLSTVRSATHMIVLENRAVAMEGPPAVVLQECAIAEELARLQKLRE